MKLEIRLGDADRERFGGDEWLEFDPTVYDDMPLDELEAIERQIGMSLWDLLHNGGLRNSARSIKAGAWLARQQAGLPSLSFAAFDVKPMQVGTRLNRQAVVPLESDSPTPGETEPESSDTSPEPAPSRRRSASSRPR